MRIRPLHVGIGTVAALTLAVTGTVVARVVADDDTPSMVSPAAIAPPAPVPSSDVADASVPADAVSRPNVSSASGRDTDLDAARRAAVVAVGRTREVFDAGAITRRDVIAEFTTARFAPMLAERTSQQLVAILFGLRRDEGRAVAVSMLSQPVTAHAEAIGDGRVAVSVWTVSVFVAEGHATAPEQWTTVRIEMVAADGRWLVDSWDVTAGPSPVPAPEGVFGTGAEVAAVVAWPSANVGED